MEQFKARVDSLIRYVKASPTRPGVKEVFIPGEIERREMEKRLHEGIPLDEPDWQSLLKVSAELGVNAEEAMK